MEISDIKVKTAKSRSVIDSIDRYIEFYRTAKNGKLPPQISIRRDDFKSISKSMKSDDLTRKGIPVFGTKK